MKKIFCFTVGFFLLFSCADSTELWSDTVNWGLSGYVRSPDSGQAVAQAAVRIRSVDKTLGLSLDALTDEDGYFLVEFDSRERPVEMDVTVSKDGWAGSRVQSVWVAGKRLLDIEQSPGDGAPPELMIDNVVPHQILANDAVNVVVHASSDEMIAQLSLSVLGGETLSFVKGNRLEYRLDPAALSRHGESVLLARAVDEKGNRSAVYLPMERPTEGARVIGAPGHSYGTMVEASATTIADPGFSGDTLFLRADFVIPRPGDKVKAVRVYRGQHGAFREVAYVEHLVFGSFFYRDDSALLRPGREYQYKFAYEGEEYSTPGPVVPVVLLPVYSVELTEPAPGKVVSSGSNVFFRWKYRLGTGDLPGGTVRQETFSVYSETNWGNRESLRPLSETLSAGENGLSLPLSHFALGLKQLWNVSSELSYQNSSSSDGAYWTSDAQSSPSVDDGYASNGFASFIREVVK